ncbi:Pleiotropic regulator 1 [Bagarius yarrelli]|uniref:Pleiotropic regulator 1 n=1 Tax=Bagarius yarrelli TaxID=175774 RepID=A0A556TZZ7_BAGYA|nr:Pleiotropic regulator 1 [Bagarius yarrelli]
MAHEEEVQKHSVHTLVFRSLKRSHDMFVADQAKQVSQDEESHKLKMSAKLRTEYGPVLHMPVLKEGKSKMAPNVADPYNSSGYTSAESDSEYLITGTHPYPSAPGVALTADTQLQKMPSEAAVHSMALALPPSQAKQDMARTAASVGEIHRHAGAAERSQAPHTLVSRLGLHPHLFCVNGGGRDEEFNVDSEESSNDAQTTVAPAMETLPGREKKEGRECKRVISGHLGWVRCLAVEPGNQWFVTGSADRTIKIWDLASGRLKLSLTGHISTVRGVAVSSRSPYLFSCGEDKQVIRHYHGHLSAVYDLDLHPTIDVLVTCSRDATARVWDIRTKANAHTLTGSHDTTIRLWDLIAGKTRATLTNHKKSVRGLVLHPQQYTFASGSPDNIKQWKFPDGNFIQNLSGHNAIINTLAVNSDGVLVSGADNGTIHMWDWRTGYNFQRIHAAVQPGSLDSESGIFSCVFDHSGSRLITAEADKTIKVYREDDTATEETHPVNWKPEILKRKRF